MPGTVHCGRARRLARPSRLALFPPSCRAPFGAGLSATLVRLPTSHPCVCCVRCGLCRASLILVVRSGTRADCDAAGSLLSTYYA